MKGKKKMISNEYLNELFKMEDRDNSLCILLGDLYSLNKNMLDSIINDVPDLNKCTREEIEFLTICSAIIEYKLFELHKLKAPEWLTDKRLRFEEPYFYQRRISGGQKAEILVSNPDSFKKRNVYFELSGLSRT